MAYASYKKNNITNLVFDCFLFSSPVSQQLKSLNTLHIHNSTI